MSLAKMSPGGKVEFKAQRAGHQKNLHNGVYNLRVEDKWIPTLIKIIEPHCAVAPQDKDDLELEVHAGPEFYS